MAATRTVSAGHAAFVGIGAYTSAVLSVQVGLTPWIGMLRGRPALAVLGTVVGYLASASACAASTSCCSRWPSRRSAASSPSTPTRWAGRSGYYITFTGDPRQFQFQDNRAYYYVALALMLIATGDRGRHRATRASAPT